MPPVRRSLAVLIAALLAGVFAVAGTSVPAGAAPKGSLQIVSVTNADKPGLGALLEEGEEFDVAVQVVDTAGQPTTVSRETRIQLTELSDSPGTLGGTTTAIIPRNGSGVRIEGAIYSKSANGVVLSVSVTSGVDLLPDDVTVDVAVTGVRGTASPKIPFELTDQDCVAPTQKVPTCGQLFLPNGADGQVTLWVGSCVNLGAPPTGETSIDCRSIGDGTTALVVTAIARLKESSDPDAEPLYSKTSPATLIVACDKALCRETANGVPQLPVIYTLSNDGPLTQTAEACPSKGTIGPKQTACVDYVQSKRHNGDLYSYLLFDYDKRASHP